MDINATLFGQIITFGVFIWFTMKFVWPPLAKIMEDRRKKIAEGLAAGEQGRKELELAQIKVKEELTEAKRQAAHILEQANQRANQIVEESKEKAREEGDRLLKLAKSEIDQEYNTAKSDLKDHISTLAVAGAERILKHNIDKASNDLLVKDLMGDI